MARAIVILAATYPSGAIGTVVNVLADIDIEQVTEDQGGRADPFLDEAIGIVIDQYHREIGPAYSPDDFSFTFYLVDDLTEMYELCGPRLLQTDRWLTSAQYPA